MANNHNLEKKHSIDDQLILAVNLRGIAEFVKDDHNGYLFPVDHGETFCHRLHQLATDAAQRQKLGEAALATSHAVSSIDAGASQMAAAIAMQVTRTPPKMPVDFIPAPHLAVGRTIYLRTLHKT